MREILFRGKDKDGNWHEGDLVHDSFDGTSMNIPVGIKKRGCYPVEVTPETVGQFTGLTDKNGVKIFEGDIIRFIDEIDTSTESGYDFEDIVCIGEIEWDNDYLKWNLTNRESIDMDEVEFNKSKVIGNIHDNPELLNQ